MPIEDDPLRPCQVGGAIEVSDIAASPQLMDCDAEGVVVTFPDGYDMTAKATGITSAIEPGRQTGAEYSQYTLINWGAAGLSAGASKSGSVQVWGSAQALNYHVELAYKSQEVGG